VLVENILKLIEVHLELLLLKEDNSSSLRDLNVLSLKAFSFTDELKDSDVKVDIERSSVRLSDNQSGLQTSFGTLDLFAPGSKEPLLIDLQLETNGVVRSQLSLELILRNCSLWELMNGTCDLLKQMPGPDDLSSLWWHVPDRWWVLLGVLIKLLLDRLQISSVHMQDMVVLVLQLMSEGVPLQDRLELR
jgi:hypothetical protein